MISRLQFVEKALLFHKLKPYLKWKRGLGPLFQAFFPLQPRFFLNKAAVFRHSQGANDIAPFLMPHIKCLSGRPGVLSP